ncbi:MAG: hypothetical protein COB85_04110, partial [Bacteroidetes bacterium]
MLSFAQVNEDFSDGDYTANPTWTGDDSLFIVLAGELRSNSAGANNYALSTVSAQALEAQWEFYINLKFSTSGANYVDVYLMSDVANLSTPNNGYFVRCGDTPDEISLYEMVGGTATIIIDGPDGLFNSASNNPFQIRVSRDASNNWVLEYDDAVTGTFVTAGSVINNSIGTSSFFGFAVVQSGAAGPVNNHYFDNITVGPIPVDSFAPTILSVTVLSDTTLDVFFSEYVDLTSSQLIGNYSANNGIGGPSTALRDGVDSTLVHLTFPIQFGNGITNILTVSNVADILSNAITIPETITFSYFMAGIAIADDVVFNEIFADPSPAVALPSGEFLELYNTSNKIFDLSGWVFVNSTTSKTLSTHILLPDEYVILCNATDTASYLPYGPVIGISSWTALTNGGDSLTLLDNFGTLIDVVAYDDSWYMDGSKDDGGWSLEQINPNHSPCSSTNNWIASNSPTGGTPGMINSVFDILPDTLSPTLLGAVVLDSVTILLTMSEGLDSGDVAQASYSFSNGLVLLSATQTSANTITLTLTSSLPLSVIYTVSISNLADCAGNGITNPNSAQFASPEQAQPGDLIINEILFNPRTNYFNSGYDFVEIYNNSQRFIDLNGWELGNVGNDTIDNLESIALTAYIVFPGEYVVLTKDTSNIKDEYPNAVSKTFLQMDPIPAYNNGDGTVVLVDNLSRVSDSISYAEDMHFVLLNDINGVSLERLDFDRVSHDKTNWHSASEAVGFATPG